MPQSGGGTMDRRPPADRRRRRRQAVLRVRDLHRPGPAEPPRVHLVLLELAGPHAEQPASGNARSARPRSDPDDDHTLGAQPGPDRPASARLASDRRSTRRRSRSAHALLMGSLARYSKLVVPQNLRAIEEQEPSSRPWSASAWPGWRTVRSRHPWTGRAGLAARRDQPGPGGPPI